MHLPAVNYLAVLVGAVVIFMLGGLWYSPLLFAKRWIALQGRTAEEMKAASAGSSMPLMYLRAFISGFVISWALAVVVGHFVSVPSAHGGALVGLFAWLGFAAPTSYATALFSMKPRALWLVDSGYNLVSFVLAGIILGVWR